MNNNQLIELFYLYSTASHIKGSKVFVLDSYYAYSGKISIMIDLERKELKITYPLIIIIAQNFHTSPKYTFIKFLEKLVRYNFDELFVKANITTLEDKLYMDRWD